VSLAALELDLDVFSGPFDLLLTLVLREEVDLLELALGDVVLAYLDHLEQRGELDLETATEFIVLVAGLLELKSRLMLSGEEQELLDIEPEQAAEELLARMLDARRYRAAAAHLGELLAREHGVRFREAPPPLALRRTIIQPQDGSQDPQVLGEAIGRLLLMPPAISVRHIPALRVTVAERLAHLRRQSAELTPAELQRTQDPDALGQALAGLLRMPPTISLRHLSIPRVSVAERLAHLRGLLRRGRFSFDEAVRGADRMTVAVTLFALLELYKRGEADWEQPEPFGEIAVRVPAGAAPVVERLAG